MQAQEPSQTLDFLGNRDPMITLIWENLLEDLSNAHSRIDTHEEHWDTWQHDFEVSRKQVSTWISSIFSNINDLRHTIEKQQNQIDELLMLTG